MNPNPKSNPKSSNIADPLQSSNEGASALYEAICKNLRSELCPLHHKSYEYFYNEQLQCEECFTGVLRRTQGSISEEAMKKWRHFYHLRSIMNNPILLLAEQKSLFQYPIQLIELLLQSYQPLFTRKNDFAAQKNLLVSFTNRIKSRINALCDQLLTSFDRAEATFVGLSTCREEMKRLSKIYQDQFLGLLSQRYQKGNKDQLQDLLSDYQAQNQSPFQKLFTNLDEAMSYLSQTPVLDLQHLTALYSTITDERLWRCNSVVAPRDVVVKIDQADMLLDEEEVTLQGQFTLQMQEEGLILKREDQDIGRLPYRFDSLYPLTRYRLLGVNYDSVQIVTYLDRLAIQATFPICGCTEVLAFQDDIVVVSNRQLIRIDLYSKQWTVIGDSLQDLRYISKRAGLFCCSDLSGRSLRFNLRESSCGKPV